MLLIPVHIIGVFILHTFCLLPKDLPWELPHFVLTILHSRLKMMLDPCCASWCALISDPEPLDLRVQFCSFIPNRTRERDSSLLIATSVACSNQASFKDLPYRAEGKL